MTVSISSATKVFAEDKLLLLILARADIPTTLRSELICKKWASVIRRRTEAVWRPKLVRAFPSGCLPVLYGNETWRDIACIYHSWSRPIADGILAGNESPFDIVCPIDPPAHVANVKRDVISWFGSDNGVLDIHDNGRIISASKELEPLRFANMFIPDTSKQPHDYWRQIKHNEDVLQTRCVRTRNIIFFYDYKSWDVCDSSGRVLLKNRGTKKLPYICGNTCVLAELETSTTVDEEKHVTRFEGVWQRVDVFDLMAVTKGGKTITVETFREPEFRFRDDFHACFTPLFNETVFVREKCQAREKGIAIAYSIFRISDQTLIKDALCIFDTNPSSILTRTHLLCIENGQTGSCIHVINLKDATYSHFIDMAGPGLRFRSLNDGSMLIDDKLLTIFDPKLRTRRVYRQPRLWWSGDDDNRGVFICVREYETDGLGVRTGGPGRDKVYWRWEADVKGRRLE
ncbi:hypothetical protein HK097_007217 [Rhizophlyctis rosea]|uniref:F-box domain-containing protein n=1 Tax=Rhizophlyctis rosea TaxID=64517 RepID=A0AAD5X624_9FUNG|nr:hypothetical protein HK097_007217 [Rhizophlyctis rosea]